MAEYTDEQLAELLQKEGDRRVTAALATAKTKWGEDEAARTQTLRAQLEREFAEKATLTAEELAAKELDARMSELERREMEIRRASNDITAKELLTGANVPKEQYSKMLGLLVNDDEESTKTNVQQFIDVYNVTRTEIETAVKSQYSNVKPPNQGQVETITKEQFIGMSYADKLKLKNTSPELYSTFIK